MSLIKFYHKPKCPFCEDAKAAFEEAGMIPSQVEVISYEEALKLPNAPSGFPFFMNANDPTKTTTGFSKKQGNAAGIQKLMSDLGLAPGSPGSKGPSPMPRQPPMPRPPKPDPLTPEQHSEIPPGVIIMFIMPTCGFCKQAQEMFADEISNGTVIPMPIEQSPSPLKSAPVLVSHDGYMFGKPPSKVEAYKKLLPRGGVEGYRRGPPKQQQRRQQVTRERYLPPQPIPTYNYWNAMDPVSYPNWNVGTL
jgi:glutaredoxin